MAILTTLAVSTLAIIGGNPTQQCQWQSVVDMGHCTGSVISENLILTAAHCMNDKMPKVKVDGETHKIKECFVHPKWELEGDKDMRYDVAICSTQNKMDTKSVPLATKAEFNKWMDYALEDNAFGIGYGEDEESGDNPKKEVRGGISIIKDLFIGFGRTGATTCNGDSGGPLMIQLPNLSWRQVGVLSYGRKSCTKETYYQRIDKVLPWIQEIKDEHSAGDSDEYQINPHQATCNKIVVEDGQFDHLTTPPLSEEGFVEPEESLMSDGCSVNSGNSFFLTLLLPLLIWRKKK